MAQRGLKSEIQRVHLGRLTLSGTTPEASKLVDTRGFNAVALELVTDTVTDAGTAAGFSVEMQESDTMAAADFTAVADAEMNGSEADLTVTTDGRNNDIIGALDYLGSKRYVRFEITGTTGTNATVDVFALLALPSNAPTTYVGTAVTAT